MSELATEQARKKWITQISNELEQHLRTQTGKFKCIFPCPPSRTPCEFVGNYQEWQEHFSRHTGRFHHMCVGCKEKFFDMGNSFKHLKWCKATKKGIRNLKVSIADIEQDVKLRFRFVFPVVDDQDLRSPVPTDPRLNNSWRRIESPATPSTPSPLSSILTPGLCMKLSQMIAEKRNEGLKSEESSSEPVASGPLPNLPDEENHLQGTPIRAPKPPKQTQDVFQRRLLQKARATQKEDNPASSTSETVQDSPFIRPPPAKEIPKVLVKMVVDQGSQTQESETQQKVTLEAAVQTDCREAPIADFSVPPPPIPQVHAEPSPFGMLQSPGLTDPRFTTNHYDFNIPAPRAVTMVQQNIPLAPPGILGRRCDQAVPPDVYTKRSFLREIPMTNSIPIYHQPGQNGLAMTPLAGAQLPRSFEAANSGNSKNPSTSKSFSATVPVTESHSTGYHHEFAKNSNNTEQQESAPVNTIAPVIIKSEPIDPAPEMQDVPLSRETRCGPGQNSSVRTRLAEFQPPTSSEVESGNSMKLSTISSRSRPDTETRNVFIKEEPPEAEPEVQDAPLPSIFNSNGGQTTASTTTSSVPLKSRKTPSACMLEKPTITVKTEPIDSALEVPTPTNSGNILKSSTSRSLSTTARDTETRQVLIKEEPLDAEPEPQDAPLTSIPSSHGEHTTTSNLLLQSRETHDSQYPKSSKTVNSAAPDTETRQVVIKEEPQEPEPELQDAPLPSISNSHGDMQRQTVNIQTAHEAPHAPLHNVPRDCDRLGQGPPPTIKPKEEPKDAEDDPQDAPIGTSSQISETIRMEITEGVQARGSPELPMEAALNSITPTIEPAQSEPTDRFLIVPGKARNYKIRIRADTPSPSRIPPPPGIAHAYTRNQPNSKRNATSSYAPLKIKIPRHSIDSSAFESSSSTSSTSSVPSSSSVSFRKRSRTSLKSQQSHKRTFLVEKGREDGYESDSDCN